MNIYKKSLKIHYVLMPFALIGLFTLPFGLVKRANEYMSIEDKFVKSTQGILSKKTLETRYDRIDSVSIEQSMFGSILDYGDIIITSGSSKHIFKGAESPHELKDAIEAKLE